MILLVITLAIAAGVLWAAKRAEWRVTLKTAARATGVMAGLAIFVTVLGFLGDSGDGYFAHAAVGWGVAAYWMVMTIVLLRAETAELRENTDTTGLPLEASA